MRERWAALTTSAWVLRTISRGYRLQFAVIPPRFSGIVCSRAQGESARILQEEIVRSGCGPVETAGFPSGYISGRLAHFGTVGAGVSVANAHTHKTSYRFGFYNKHREEHAVPSTEYNISGVTPGAAACAVSGPSPALLHGQD